MQGYHRPTTLEEACGLLSRHGDTSKVLAGGTDLVIQLRRRRIAAEHIVDISGLRDLRGIRETADHVIIGALTLHKMIETSEVLNRRIPMLVEAAKLVGGHQVRNAGTAGGNIVNASPAADLVVPLLASHARLVLVEPAGRREIDLDRFLLGPGKVMLHAGEILTDILVPKPPIGTTSVFLKAGRRRAMEISVMAVAASLRLVDGRCRDVRIALGAVAPQVFRVGAAEAAIEGKSPSPAHFDTAGKAAADTASPRSDVRASAAFRSILVERLVRRALDICVLRTEASV